MATDGTTVQYTLFDKAGRVLRHTQTVDAPSHSFTYEYNRAGLPTQVTYPSTRVISTSYDAAGRVKKVTGSLSGVETTYAGGLADAAITYTPAGAVTDVYFGKLSGTPEKWAVHEQRAYNSRLQVTSIAQTDPAAATIRSLNFGYGTTENNGNLLTQTISGVGLSAAVAQGYQYDRLNRLAQVSEGTTWSRSYGHDQYGNHWVSAFSPVAFSPGASTPLSESAFDASTNRVTLNGAAYDASGQQTGIGGYGFTYNAEGLLKKSVLSTATMYRYDGNGRRVLKIDCPTAADCQATTTGAVVTRYVYDANGTLAAESAGAASAPPCLTCYVMQDHLGSRRVLTGSTGKPARCHDYEPYGEELPGGAFGRTGCYGTSASTGLLFTGKERDAETGLDYFGARYLSSQQERFTSPDPITVTALRVVDPQQFNRYAYGRNNPLRFIDPDGMDPIPTACEGPGDNTCYTTSERLEAERKYEQDVQMIAPVVLPSGDGGPIQRAGNVGLGWFKQSVSDLLDLMSLGSPTEPVRELQGWLQPSNQRQKAGAEANRRIVQRQSPSRCQRTARPAPKADRPRFGTVIAITLES